MEQLKFEYIKTYSGFHGDSHFEKEERIKSKLIELNNKLKVTLDYKDRYYIKKNIQLLESDSYNNRLIDTKNNLHLLADEVATIQKNSKTKKQLISIFTNNRIKEPFIVTACPPIYRDAFVFFDNNRIVKIIHCCFECISIIDEHNNSIHLNHKGLEQLRKLLINLGHKIN